MADRKDQKKRKLFCTSQGLSLLHPQLIPHPRTVKDCLSGDEFWRERHADWGGEEVEGKPWMTMQRDTLIRALTLKGDMKRLAVVCAGGYGKSANLEYLEGMLAKAGQVVFRFELDEKTCDLPEREVTFWNETLPDQFRIPESNADLDDTKCRHILQKLRDMGRMTLLFDSIDQATKPVLRLLKQLFEKAAWGGCPVVISARPHAVYDQWASLIKPDVSAWHFLRVEPLAEEQRQLLLGPNLYVSA